MMSKIIYLANPYGFSQQQKELLLPPIINKLKSLGAEVWEPFERNNQLDFSKPGWAYKIAQADLDDVKNCDGIFA
ncbi:MAG: nucleoside 2-deoxyribosyltransferase, partial [Cyanobacteria bacterium J06629_18]